MVLSKRLGKIVDYVPKCGTVTDIGTDHAFIPIYLALNNVAKKVIAADISKGSVDKAEKNVSFYNCSHRVECRCGDGLSVLSENECSDVIIAAGMGGMLVIHVLEVNDRVLKNAKRLILQPQRDNDKVRRFVHKKGFKIIAEDIFKDEGKIYNIIVCEKGNDTFYSDKDYIFGKLPIEEKNSVLKEFILHETNRMRKVADGLISDEEHILKRKNELLDKCRIYEEVSACL